MGDTQEKNTTKKNCVRIILDARKGEKESMMFYLRAKRYAPEVQEAQINLTEEKKDGNGKK